MCPHVPFQLVSVSAGVAAQAALEGPFASVRADVPFQFADLETKKEKVLKIRDSPII